MSLSEEGIMLAIKTTDASNLWDEIEKSLEAGEDAYGRDIRTWELDGDGSLRHTGEQRQWYPKGRFEVFIYPDRLAFLFRPAEERRAKGAYGVLHGRLCELLISHFNDDKRMIYFRDLRP
jgi:hypothetical protein